MLENYTDMPLRDEELDEGLPPTRAWVLSALRERPPPPLAWSLTVLRERLLPTLDEGPPSFQVLSLRALRERLPPTLEMPLRNKELDEGPPPTLAWALRAFREDCLRMLPMPALDASVPKGNIENQYPDQYEIGRCFGIPRLFSKRDILNSQKQMKYIIAAAAAIFGANCQQMQSLKGAGTALGQAALIACASSWLITLLLILAFVALPSLSYTKAKLVTGLAAFLTASSHFAFVAMNLGPISKYTVGMLLLAAFVCSSAMLYMRRTTEIKSAPAALEGISTE